MAETLYDLLQRAAADHGLRVAVEFKGERIRYSELLDAADRTASLLQQYGAGPGERVGFCFRKSIDALVALFAAIRTGATYVPLDPAWPAERIGTICRDAGIALWLGSRAPSTGGIKSALVSAPPTDAADRGDTDVVLLSSARDCLPARTPPASPAHEIANILYTSGSTGRPKGVQITTRSLLHFSQWVVETFALAPEDRVANHAPYNFDLSTLDIFAAVRAGAAMHPVPEETKMLPYQTARFIAEERITIWYSVPSALTLMQSKLAAHDVSSLRHVIFAGEVMPKPALQALAGSLPGAALTNLYGPTETNVCTWYRVGPADLKSADPLPIGQPISEMRTWLIDEQEHLLEGQATGELLVAGPTVTSGYFGDPELTARRLIPAPDGDGMAYRTGDRVMRRGDWLLVFQERIDRMFKCRGHRVEPGEIEAVLCAHAGVPEAAVVPVRSGEQEVRIKACVVPAGKPHPTEAELLAHCRQRLPAYMLPEFWEFLERLPRTDRGKVDLRQLAATAEKRPS